MKKIKRCPDFWDSDEKIVYEDEDFAIVKRPAKKGNIFEVVPITKTCNRLDDFEICPEPNSLIKAKRLMEQNRPYVQSYKNALGKYD